MKRFYLLGISVFLGLSLIGQGVALKPGATPPNGAVLELGGTDKGFLMPRMDSTAKANIPGPANGLWLFQDKQDSGFYYYDADYWRRAHQTYGSVQMDNTSSIILDGQGFTVEHLAKGVDEITFRHFTGEPISHKPEVIVSGEVTELPMSEHGNESVYCIEDYNGCADRYIAGVFVSNTTTGATNYIQSATTCSPNTYYNHGVGDNSINNCLSQGDLQTVQVNIIYTTPPPTGVSNTRLSIWIDYNGDGDFDDANEQVVANATPVIGPNIFPLAAAPAIPVSAQGSFTRMRVMYRDFSFASTDPCIQTTTGFQKGEVEDYYIPLCASSYPTGSPVCSVSKDINNTAFTVYCEDINGNAINVKYHFKIHEK